MSGGVLVIGDVITDIIAIPEGPILRGSDRRASIRTRPGGSGANQAVWLAALGVDVRFVARVGAADHARHTDHLRAHGVRPLLVADPVAPSGVLISIVDADGERSFLTDRGANLNLCAADLPDTLLDGVGKLLVSGYALFAETPRAAVLALMRAARARGIATAIDAASAGFLRDIGAGNFLDWTAGTGTIFANRDEAQQLTGAMELNLQMQGLGRFYDQVVIKRGAAGAALGSIAGTALSLGAPATAMRDSTGAGDAFAAAFIAAELAGETPEAALRAGIAAGARAVAGIGGQPPIS
jgi:sugar/nucleoside kinase (ribokinase family)